MSPGTDRRLQWGQDCPQVWHSISTVTSVPWHWVPLGQAAECCVMPLPWRGSATP